MKMKRAKIPIILTFESVLEIDDYIARLEKISRNTAVSANDARHLLMLADKLKKAGGFIS